MQLPGSRPVLFGGFISEAICFFLLDSAEAAADAAARWAAAGNTRESVLAGRHGATAGALAARGPETLRPWRPREKQRRAAQKVLLALLWVDTRINKLNELFYLGQPSDPGTQRQTRKHIDQPHSLLVWPPQKAHRV